MKKYTTLAKMLLDYRRYHGISQAEFAASIDVDMRTIQRWEKGVTFIKSENEYDIIQETLLPYQLLRNLNTANPIPTFYDFNIHKYSLDPLSNDLPDASWFKTKMGIFSKNIRTLNFETDFDYVLKYMKFHKNISNNLFKVIKQSIQLLPELNLIINDDSGNYSGHSLVFPIKSEVQEKLKNRSLKEADLTVNDLVNYKTQKVPYFYGYHITADCNDNVFYMFNHFFRFFQNQTESNYVYSSSPVRRDNYKLNEQLGLKIIWEDQQSVDIHGMDNAPRFYEGNFTKFLS